jgi:PspA associated protein B
MGLLNILTGKRALAKPAPDRLFAISTAYVTLETGLQITTRGSAAIVFQSLQTADFAGIVRDMKEVVTATATDTATTVETSEDSYGFSWLILRGADFDSLVAGVNAVSTALQDGGYGERILCAVFAFEDERKRRIYLLYNYKRGAWYPFVPSGPQARDNERELVLRAQVGAELPLEAELSRWFPLWGIPI